MPYRFLTADVFTDRMFGGNPLAVLPDARGLSGEQMLAITREFNYSESTFVLPPERGGTRRVRIFTPAAEIPFAGHPTVGTAHVLAAIGEIPLADGTETRVVLEEGVGDVSVTIRAVGGQPTFSQLSVAKLPEVVSEPPDLAALAEVLSLSPDDFVGGPWAPVAVSCGLPFLMVAVKSRDAVRRARVRMEPWERTLAGTPASEMMVFTLDAGTKDADVHARVFVPGLSVPEDPATGSACAALGGFLAQRTPRDGGTLRWAVAQGVDMGRPSRLEIEVDKAAGAVTGVRVGGSTVLVSEGTLRI